MDARIESLYCSVLHFPFWLGLFLPGRYRIPILHKAF